MNIKINIDDSLNLDEVVITVKKPTEKLINLLEQLKKDKIEKIVGEIDGNKYLIKSEEIINFYANDKKVFMKTKDREYIVRYRLYELAKILDTSKFLRISNSEIVNIDYVRKLDTSFNGQIVLETIYGDKSYVSRTYLQEFKKILEI